MSNHKAIIAVVSATIPILGADTGGMQPYFLKSKSFHFRTMEGLCEAVDTEDMEAA